MKKVTALTLACVSLISAISFSTAYAADRAGAVSFTLGGGETYLSGKRHLKNTGIGFGAIGYDMTANWGVEALLGVMNTHYKHRWVLPTRGRSVNLTLFSFDAVYHFTPCFPSCTALVPYVMAGVGILGQNKGQSAANNQGNINAGLGLAYFVHPSVAFRAEARDFYTIKGGKNDVMLDVGLSFLLDTCC